MCSMRHVESVLIRSEGNMRLELLKPSLFASSFLLMSSLAQAYHYPIYRCETAINDEKLEGKKATECPHIAHLGYTGGMAYTPGWPGSDPNNPRFILLLADDVDKAKFQFLNDFNAHCPRDNKSVVEFFRAPGIPETEGYVPSARATAVCDGELKRFEVRVYEFIRFTR